MSPAPYLDTLMVELDGIENDIVSIMERSTIINVDPNRRGGDGVRFIGYPRWGWGPSDELLEADRMALLRRLRDWEPRFHLLFPHPTPQVSKQHRKAIGHLIRWLEHQRDKTIPGTIDAATAAVRASIQTLRDARHLLPTDPFAVRLAPDTNALVDNPDLAAYIDLLGPRYVVHVLPVVLRELDDLKRSGRTPELREAARRADRRLKGLRDNGDVRVGARVAGEVWAVFEHIDPQREGLPSWLDLDVPDDRFVASALLLQSDHPGSALSVATSDLNLQTKLAAVGVPHIELDQDS